MIELVRSSERYHFQNEWLSTYWHFSFDHYYDPKNINFGPLRVFNDDTIAPARGFGMHGHKEMEILTYVLSGELEHRDSRGNHGIIAAGEVQRMSAGRGISHSEVNSSRENPVHLLQIWIEPAVRGLTPSWEQRNFAPEARRGTLLPVVSGRETSGALRIHQDATMYVAGFSPGQELVHSLAPDRRAYLFVIEGAMNLNEAMLTAGDVAKLIDSSELRLAAHRPSEILLLDLP